MSDVLSGLLFLDGENATGDVVQGLRESVLAPRAGLKGKAVLVD